MLWDRGRWTDSRRASGANTRSSPTKSAMPSLAHPAVHLTVAAIAERDGRFLLVEEREGERLVINQPAGHLEPDEDLPAAVVRETLEETGWHFSPTALVVWLTREELVSRTARMSRPISLPAADMTN